MKVIRISAATRELLAAHALPGKSLAEGVLAPDGDGFVVALEDDVFARLEQLSDDPDEAIRLACTHQLGRA